MSADLAENQHEFAPFWAVHSEKDGQPSLRAWAKSEADAAARMAEIQKADRDPSSEYWVMQMTAAEVESFKIAGVIPEDA